MFVLVYSDIINELPCHLFEERIVMARRERITPVDTAWLRMDHPNNLMTIIGVVLSLTDPDGATQVGEVDDPAHGAVEDDEDHGGLWRMLFEAKTGAVIAGIRYSGSLLEKSLSLLTNPGQALDTIRDGAGIAVEIANLAMMPDDAKTRFKGIPGIAKRVAWSEPILLPENWAITSAWSCPSSHAMARSSSAWSATPDWCPTLSR